MYLVNTRSGTKDKITKATVAGVRGVILLPDDWSEVPAGISLTITSADWTTNTYNATQWKNKLETAGAVFLPAAGQRSGTTVSVANETAYYWSMTYDQTYHNAACMYSTSGRALTHNVSKHPSWGCSVRLVQPYDNSQDGIEEIMANPAIDGHKVFIDGQLFIRRGNKLFNATGIEMK